MHIQNLWLIGLHFIIYGAIAILLEVSLNGVTVAIGLTLIWISLVDIQRFEIPDTATVLLFLLASLRLWMEEAFPVENALGAVIWPLIFFFTARMYESSRGRAGLGFGDVKLMVSIGFLCGFTGSVYVVLAAAVSGMVTLIAVFKLRTRAGAASRDHLSGTALAFAPFLCLGAWAVVLLTDTRAATI